MRGNELDVWSLERASGMASSHIKMQNWRKMRRSPCLNLVNREYLDDLDKHIGRKYFILFYFYFFEIYSRFFLSQLREMSTELGRPLQHESFLP